MPSLRLALLTLLVFGSACSGSRNPPPLSPGPAGTGATQGADTILPQAPAAPAAAPATNFSLDREAINCHTCSESCTNKKDEDVTDLDCKVCREEISGCSQDMTADGTIYYADLRGVPMQQGMGYGMNRLFPGAMPYAGGGYSSYGRQGGGYSPYAGGGYTPYGRPGGGYSPYAGNVYTPYRGQAGGITPYAGGGYTPYGQQGGGYSSYGGGGMMVPFRSAGFQGYSANLSAAFCGMNRFDSRCQERVSSESFHRCHRVIGAMDDASYQLEHGASPREVYLTLARAKPMVDQEGEGTSLSGAFTGLLNELRQAPVEILSGATAVVGANVRGMAGYALQRAPGILAAPANRWTNQMRYMARGFNYLGYQQNPGDVCNSNQETVEEYRYVCTCTYYSQTNCN